MKTTRATANLQLMMSLCCELGRRCCLEVSLKPRGGIFLHFLCIFREFFTGKVLPIRLPSRDNSNTFEGEIGTLSGWGFRDTRQINDPNVLYYIKEAVLSNEECTLQNKNPTYPPIVESEICISTEYGKTACPGENFKLFNEFL